MTVRGLLEGVWGATSGLEAIDRIKAVYPDESNYRYLGDTPNNIGIVNNQQPDPMGAVAEKSHQRDRCLHRTRPCSSRRPG